MSAVPNGHVVDVDEGRVIQLRIDFAFTLVLSCGIVLRIEAPFTYIAPDRRSSVVLQGEQQAAGVAAALPALGDTVERITVADSGRMSILFASEAHIDVPTDQPYEGWNLQFPGGSQWIGLPDGGGVTRQPSA